MEIKKNFAKNFTLRLIFRRLSTKIIFDFELFSVSLNYGFDLRFYCGDNENPTESDFTITDPTELGVIVLDEAGTTFKHLLPNRYAEKTWKILVDDSIDMEKLK